MSLREYENKKFSPECLTAVKSRFDENFHRSVELYGDRPFLVFVTKNKATVRTYSELARDVSLVENYLLHSHFASDIVVTASDNSYEHIVFLFAAMVSGFTVFPLNPRMDRLLMNYILGSLARPYSLFSGPESMDLGKIPAVSKKIAKIRSADDFVYILTSGSTGRSKIVRQTEHGVFCNVQALISHHRLASPKVIGTPLPLYHVNALEFSLLCTLCTGGKLVLFENFNFGEALGSVQSQGIQIYSAIPTILRNIAEHADQARRSDWGTLDYFVSAAAPLSADTVSKVLSKTGKRVIQGYGLSEAVNFSCTLPVDLDDSDYADAMLESKYPSIGTPLWGNHVKILKLDGSEAAEGEQGEIAVSGFNLMAGYLGEAETDLDHPDSFRTGDLGYFRILNGKSLFYISGRSKEVARRNGESIPLRDLDDLIFKDLPFAFDGMTMSFKNDPRDEEIGLVCRIGDEMLPDNWKDLLCERLDVLPQDRRPKVILVTDKPIRTPSGKPLRWAFAEDFEEFRKMIFGKKVVFKIGV